MFRGFKAILFKEFTIIFRDPTTLFFMFFPPLIQLVAFGFALDMDVKHMAMVVLDEDRTVESRQFVQKLVNSETFRVVQHVNSVNEMTALIRRGKAYVGVQIPPEFTRELRAGRNAQVQVLVDGSNSNIALSALNSALAVAFRESLGILLAQTGRRDLPVEVRPQMLFNPDMRSPNFFVPGVIGIALQIATVFATALSMVRERERGTLEQLLVSPLSRWGLMLGKILPYLCISSTLAVFFFLVLRWVFFIPIHGSLPALALGTFLYIFTLLSLGLLISTRAENHMQALQMTMTLLLPTVFFSGFIFPRETMPDIFYGLSVLLPPTYYIDLLRGVVLRGGGFADFSSHLAILAGMSIGLFLLCALRYRKNIA
ncbi:MAG TPA: ABC transporter permease [Methylomirabilota bacterium]|nr:ABC transporter permease [Methylomirabilota bacterium]